MAVPAATYQAFQAVGNREDISDMIFDLSVTEKPFTQAIKKTTAKNTKHEWQTDALASASATNAHIQGDDSAAATATPTVRLGNYTQILKKTISVARTQRKMRTAGREDEFQYQLKKRMAELGNDLESSLTQNNATTAGAAGSAALMASAESWLATNKTSAGQGTAQTTPGQVSGLVSTAPTDSTTAGTLTEAAFRNVLQLIYTNGGDASIAMCGAVVKQKISQAFTGIATKYREVPKGKQAEITAGADLYVHDFGEIKIVPNRRMRTNCILVIDPDMWALSTYDAFSMERLAKTGDSDKAHIVGEYTLECRNELSSGKVTDINGAL